MIERARARCVPAALCVLVGVAACGANATAGGGPSASTNTTSASGAGTGGARTSTAGNDAPAPACAPATHTLCITAADANRTIVVHVGATFTVELRAPRHTFSEPVLSGAKALRLIAASRSGAAAEASYRAVAPGRVRLRSAERPVCRLHRACPLYVLLWQAEVLVKPRPPSRAG